MANVGAGLFMGMPVTSVIARSSLNARAGAKTRLPGLVQSGFVFGSIVFASSTIAMIPMPALSGMLIFTGANMLYPSEFNYCYTVDRFTTLPYFTTVGGLLSMGLAEGVGIGCATAVALAVHKNMELRVKMQVLETNGDVVVNGQIRDMSLDNDYVLDQQDPSKMRVLQTSGAMVCTKSDVPTTVTRPLLLKPTSTVYQISGPINFLSMFEIDELAEDIKERKNPEDPIVLDFRHVTSLDFTGVEELVGRVIEASEGAEIISITRRNDINNTVDKVDKDKVIARYSSVGLIA
jgi:MFS superfamily sulfate permease-like transporter